MKSESIGAETSAVEVLNVSPHGFWLLVNGAQYERFAPATRSRADIVVLDIEDAVAPKDTAAARKELTDMLLERFDLIAHQKKQFRQLSVGLKRRVVLARALINDPKLIILDEPTAGVDVELRRVLWRYLAEINKDGRTILLTSHYLEEVERLCRDVAIVNKGKIVRQGTKDEIAGAPGGLEEAYLAVTGAQAEHVAGQ